MSQSVQVVRRLFAAVEARDVAAVLACYSDDLEIREVRSLPYGGVYRGRHGARHYAEAFARAWGPYQDRREPLVPSFGELDDGRVVAVFRHRAIDSVHGHRLDEVEVGIYDVRGEAIVGSIMVHADPQRLARFLTAGSAR